MRSWRSTAAEGGAGLALACLAMLAHLQAPFAWQMAGSFLGILALWLLGKTLAALGRRAAAAGGAAAGAAAL
ncbi:MAG: hypothetical protein FJ098_12485, partial [Deltaproteobacteria bacterium]|nr:hypothetical protein [Deltaproteobacteria bacterium]